MGIALVEIHERNSWLNEVPDLTADSAHCPIVRRRHGELHLHGFQGDERIAGRDRLALVHMNRYNRRRHRRGKCRVVAPGTGSSPTLLRRSDNEDAPVEKHPRLSAGSRRICQ